MTPTEYKLAEARYFLDQLKITDPCFDFILSAYLNAARSVTWVMRNEWGSMNGWSDWFAASEVSGQEAELLAEMNRLRIQATKQGGVTTEHYILPGVVVERNSCLDLKEFFETTPEGSEVRITIAAAEDSANAASSSDHEESGTWKFRARVQHDVNVEEDPERRRYLDLSHRYYTFLERKVSECIALFAK
jgi:hypothetical protein